MQVPAVFWLQIYGDSLLVIADKTVAPQHLSPQVQILGPLTGVAQECEAILRSLPRWFGIEAALQQYASNTERFPTFVVREDGSAIAFVTLQEHFPTSWEVHCIAVDAAHRGRGVGRALQAHIEAWLLVRGAKFIQVKTLAASHASAEYAETRQFYFSLGYVAHEVFPELWAKHLPVLQMVKVLQNAG